MQKCVPTVADPDLQIRGGPSHPDPEIWEGGSLRKIRGELGPPHPSPTDLPLDQMCKWYI